MKTRTKIVAGILAATLISTVVYGALIAHWDIQTSMRIKRTVSIEVYDVDGVTPLMELNLGDLTWNIAKAFPGGLDYTGKPPAELYYVKNTDQTDFYVGFNVDPAIEGITFKLLICRGDKTEWKELSVGGAPYIYQDPLVSSVNDPNPDVQFAYWYLAVHVAEPVFGNYSAVLRINAYDSAAG